MIDLWNRKYQHILETHDLEIDEYNASNCSGMDRFALWPPDDDLSTVTVEYVPHIINDLQPPYNVNPLDECEQYGIDLLLRALNILCI